MDDRKLYRPVISKIVEWKTFYVEFRIHCIEQSHVRRIRIKNKDPCILILLGRFNSLNSNVQHNRIEQIHVIMPTFVLCRNSVMNAILHGQDLDSFNQSARKVFWNMRLEILVQRCTDFDRFQDGSEIDTEKWVIFVFGDVLQPQSLQKRVGEPLLTRECGEHKVLELYAPLGNQITERKVILREIIG